VVFGAVGLLGLGLPIREAASDVVGSWKWAVDARIANLPFYRRVRGTFDMSETARVLPVMTLGYVIVFGVPALIARFWRAERSGGVERFALWLVVCGGILVGARNYIQWEEAGRPLIVVAGICTIALGRNLTKGVDISGFVFALFSLLLLAKTALDVRLYHYGFALSAPALVLAIAMLVGRLPAWIDGKGGSGAILRGSSIAVILVTAGMYLRFEYLTTTFKTTVVGSGGDAFYATAKGETINHIVGLLQRLPGDATVAVVPQGAMVNYLARRENPTSFIVMMPPEVIMFSQGRIIQSLAEHPPDLVVLVDSDVTEYGFRAFNVDYGRPIFEWIMGNYHVVAGNPQDPNLKWVMVQRNQGFTK
jgi:hypothetical protein